MPPIDNFRQNINQAKIHKIGPLERVDHCHITSHDDISFLWEYISEKGYEGGNVNRLILNLKKSPLDINKPGYHYKNDTILNIAKLLSTIKGMSNYTIVPIPPSKSKNDSGYDDRLIQILRQWSISRPTVQYMELIYQNNSTNASHLSEQRLKPQALLNNYRLDKSLKLEEGRKIILIFDDILTTGSHYKAMASLLKKEFPDKQIKGFFLARRVFPKNR